MWSQNQHVLSYQFLSMRVLEGGGATSQPTNSADQNLKQDREN